MPNPSVLRSRASRTVAAAGNYTAGDIVSDNATTGTAWEFPDLSPRGTGTACIIFKGDIVCNATNGAVTASYRLHLFSKVPTTTELRDNVAKAFTAADMANYLGVITFPAMTDEGTFSRAHVDGLTMGAWADNSSGIVYGVLEDLSGETNESAAMTITMTLWAA